MVAFNPDSRAAFFLKWLTGSKNAVGKYMKLVTEPKLNQFILNSLSTFM